MKKIYLFLLVALCLSTRAYADKVTASTTLPENGKPEHVYTMVSGNAAYVSPTTTPVEGDAENGLFAFYAVEGVNGAYYIYSHNAKQWLSYDKKASYPTGVSFIKMSDTKVEGTYFKVENYADDFYQISPYTTAGTAQAVYLNYFGGVAACSGKTLGLWTDNGAKDGGSRYTFAEHVIVERTYTISVPAGVTLKIDGREYADGAKYTTEGSLDKSKVSLIAAEGKFAVASVNDVNNTIVVSVATLPELPAVEKYENAWVYPKQQDNVGAASISKEGDAYITKNNVLAASWMKVGDAIYFAGCDAMDLVAGTEPFTVAFGAGDNVPASAMTLKSVTTETLAAKPTAIGGAEHFAGVQLVANYEYTYKGSKIAIVWRAILRDGSHYIRTEMDLTGIDDVDMFNIIPMIYNVDTQAAGSAPKVVGNTRGATLVSDKIFAGLETPTAYNTVGEATGEENAWELKDTKSVSLTASSWAQVTQNDLPNRVTEATGAGYPNVLAYKMTNVVLKENQRVEIEVKYTNGNHRLNFGGADLLDTENNIAASDYHSGYSGSQHSNNTFVFTAPYDGTFSVRVFVENKTESIDASSNMTVKIYEAKEGVVINTAIVGIQGRWSRNTTLAADETWKVGAVVGLIAQDGTQNDANIRNTQKRRSFLAYSERERAVPWRAFPCYISWYELNIDRNNAADPTQNMNANQVLDVLANWKTNFYDKYGEGPAAFIIDDGWDNYGPWTFHNGFPNEMRDISVAAKEMGAGIGAWLGPVGGYGTSGNYRRSYWNQNNRGGMQLSNPLYYDTFLKAAENLVCNQDGQAGFNPNTDNYMFFKYDGISAQFSAVGPDAGDTGNENAEGIIRLERYVRENLREDIFFNTTVGTWASPFWYQITDATWRQEGDYGEAGNNSIDREKWITYRDRLVYQNYVSNSPMCPINTLMTHGFILTRYGAVSKNMDYAPVLRELRCAFLCGSGMVELYNDYELMNSINGGKLWEDLAECIAWQKKNADVLPDAHWVGGNPWTGSAHEVYGWASWNGTKATLALRNGSNSQQTYTFTLRRALEIPANINGAIILNKSFKVQDALSGLTEGVAIDIDQELTVTLPANSVYAFDGANEDVIEDDITLNWTTSTPWIDVNDYTSTVFNDAALGYGVKYIENEIAINGSRTATVTFTYSGGNCALNIRGVEVIDANDNIVAGDYHVGKTGTTHTNNIYRVSMAEAGKYTVRYYATFGPDDRANATNGTITVKFNKEDIANFTHNITFVQEYATLHLGYQVGIPNGVEAYCITATNKEYATLEPLYSIIPAATPVILRRTDDEQSYNFAYTKGIAANIKQNLLKGSIADRYVSGSAYVLGVVDDEVCLAKAALNQVGNTSFKNNANKAYLPTAEGASLSASLRFDFGGTTAIEEVETKATETVIYDLTGRRVNEITKAGIYIVNGKKVLVK